MAVRVPIQGPSIDPLVTRSDPPHQRFFLRPVRSLGTTGPDFDEPSGKPT